MNTLWASLVGLIVIALAVVLAFNHLQGRQLRMRDEWRERLAGGGKPSKPVPSAATAPEHSDAPASLKAEPPGAVSVPAAAERIEPTFGAGHTETRALEPADRKDEGMAGRLAPEMAAAGPIGSEATGVDAAEAGSRPVDTPIARPLFETGPVLDPRLDCIVAFTLTAPVASERLLTAVSAMRRAGSKPVAFEADSGDGRWSVPHAARDAVRRVRAGVLLANRHGPLNAMEFSEFGSAMQSLAGAIGASGTPVPQMAAVLEHARQLDDACARLDAVIGLNIETPTALSPGELTALSQGLGLVERGNNRFAQLGDDGEVLFSLALGDRAERLTLLLDVPRAPQEEEPWGRMIDCARQCAERTGGKLVDDADRALTVSAVAEVERQLVQRYRSLQEAGLDAGSTAALRVFN
jgi:hypothetical protein